MARVDFAFNFAPAARVCAPTPRPGRFDDFKMKKLFSIGVLFGLFATALLRAQSTATVAVQVSQPGAVISSNLFGIFFEEINFAGEGGVYAEMVRNRAFYDAATPWFWTLVTNGTATGTMTVDAGQPLNTNTPNALKLTFTGGSGNLGAANAGFWGMSLTAGATYDLNFYVRATNGFSGPLNARLESATGGSVYAQTNFSGLTTNWQKFSAALVSSGTDTNARLVLSLANSGTVWLDVVSLFPRATYLNRTNGLRADLASLLADLKPSSRMPCAGKNPSAISRIAPATTTIPGATGPRTVLARMNFSSSAKTCTWRRSTASTPG